MKKRRTIIEAAIEVLKHSYETLSVSEIYAKIVESSLYEFHAQDPLSVLRVELRGHSVGIDYPSASSKKYFLYDEGSRTFELVNTQTKHENVKKEATPLSILRKLHHKYTHEFKAKTLRQLKGLNPYDFELFCKKILEKYGSHNLIVTKKSRDGSIDGYGKLKVGLAYMNVAFLCKRWGTNKIGRKEIDAFRGAVQGEYEQGLYFKHLHFPKKQKKVLSNEVQFP
ncbi:restriction endonuclease [Segatella buccae]